MTHYYEFDQYIHNLIHDNSFSDNDIPFIIENCYDTIINNYTNPIIIKQLLGVMYFKLQEHHLIDNLYSIDNVINIYDNNSINNSTDNSYCKSCKIKISNESLEKCNNCNLLFKYNNLYDYVNNNIFDNIKKNHILSLLKYVPQRSIEEFHYITSQLKLIPQPEQRSQEWFDMRSKMLTASDAGTITGVNPYKSISELIHEKCGLGKPFKGNNITEWGVKYEPCATSIYEIRKKCTVVEYGLIPHPILNNIGASPDGITDDGIMLEIKCPPSRKITGIPPIYYVAQMQMQLEVCNLDVCDFMECKFLEYFNIYDFLEDSGDIMGFTKDNFEKGIVVSAFNLTEKKLNYFYSLIDINDSSKIEWSNKEMDRLNNDSNFNNINVTYWHLTLVSIVQVHRDKEWFANNYIKMNNFWNDVIYARKYGIQDKYKPKLPKSPKKMKPIICEIEFDSDSDSDSEPEPNPKPKLKSKPKPNVNLNNQYSTPSLPKKSCCNIEFDSDSD